MKVFNNRTKSRPLSGMDISTSIEEFREAERESRKLRNRKHRSEQKQLKAEMNRQWEQKAKNKDRQ